MMEKEMYLYGAAVQGIQSFIFQTNELKDIAGASELVSQICTYAFDDYGKDDVNGISVVQAAGNIKFIFNSKQDCQKAVLEFPKKVMEMAPGITISQAVVSYHTDTDQKDKNFKNAIKELERRLHIQRNHPVRSLTMGQIGMLRSRKTGMPVVKMIEDKKENKKEYIDLATAKKREPQPVQSLCGKSFGMGYVDPSTIAYQIDDIALNNDWIAIIHADGNGLGQILPLISANPAILKQFSKKLDQATSEAANIAFTSIYEKHHFGKKIPLRPIVLSGDDMTIICRGDFALDYAKAFMNAFEEKTREHLSDIISDSRVFSCSSNHLTACAGIAYIKSSYPFHYGYHLAERLCGEAKKEAKNMVKENGCQNLPPSSLMFHKVHSSFIEDYDEIVRKELTSPSGISFKFGSYYLTQQNDNSNGEWSHRWTIEKLMYSVEKMNDETIGNAIKSHLREWLTLLINNPEQATSKLERLSQMLNLKSDSAQNESRWNDWVSEITDLSIKDQTPVYDILSICSINYQVTKIVDL